MKVWIGSDSVSYDFLVKIFTKKPRKSQWRPYYSCFKWSSLEKEGSFCRSQIRRLLRGTGKKLPKHGSKQLVEIKLTAK